MHDDDETRFPRISLWQFLGGVLRGIAHMLNLTRTSWVADMLSPPVDGDAGKERKQPERPRGRS
jgi:hypothetical protein